MSLYDLGGGTFDCSILQIEKSEQLKEFQVLGTSGDMHLGGADFDLRLVEHFIGVFQSKNANIDANALRSNTRAMNRLRKACVDAKIELSDQDEATVELDSLFAGIDLVSTITRLQFEEICNDLFQKSSLYEPCMLDL